MSPLRKYIPRQVPKEPVHPVDLMLNGILWLCALGVVVCVFRIITKT